jgi:hypothetical protein
VTPTPDSALAVTPDVPGRPRVFDGEINGFRLYDFDGASKDVEFPNIWCNARQEQIDEAFRLEYAPQTVPSSYFEERPYRWTCVDGSPGMLTQRFTSAGGTWTVVYNYLSKAIPSLATEDRVSGGSIQGKPAVIAAPEGADGKGTSFVAFDYAGGWIAIEVTDLPLEETLTIAEGISLVCEDC